MVDMSDGGFCDMDPDVASSHLQELAEYDWTGPSDEQSVPDMTNGQGP